MPANQKIAPSSPISSSSSDNPNKILPFSFTLKPNGLGGARNTLVENDSLSSYSWPEDTPRRQTGRSSDVEKSGRVLTQNENKDEGRESSQTSHKEKGHLPNDVNNPEHSGPTQDPSYVEAYMKFMYWTCLSPFNPTQKICGAESWCDLVLNVFQKLFLAIITTLSMIQSAFEIKYNLLDNLSYPDLETFTDMCFFVMNGATKVYYMYLFLAQQRQLTKMLSSIANLRASPLQSSVTNKKVDSSMKYALFLVTSSFLVTFVQIIWGRGIIGWTPKKAVLHHSTILGKALRIWNKHDHVNETLIEELDEEYGEDLTSTNLILGIFRMMIILSSNIQTDAITNVILTNVETVKEAMNTFERKINDSDTDLDNVTLEQFLANSGHWAYLKRLKLTVKDNNDAMDVLMRYKHINNLVLFVYIAMNAFDGQLSLIYFIRVVYNLILTSYMYRIASQASNLNDATKKWILRLAWKSADKPFQEKVPLILYEFEKEPIGLGKGHFLIDESFIFRFLGSVGSVFVLQAQTRTEINVDCERV